MPTTRRSAGGRSSTGPAKQSTLSFPHRVTKNVPKSGKDNVVSTAPAKKSPLSKDVKADSDGEEDTAVAQVAPVEEPQLDEPEEEKVEPAAPVKSAAEVRAEKVTGAAVEKYWKKLEAQRTAKRVHQEDLTTGEKVLRYFDVSSQYGPCIGITRTKRWYRAERLGLNPPIEVLAVLLMEEAKGSSGIEQAQMDSILNTIAVGAN